MQKIIHCKQHLICLHAEQDLQCCPKYVGFGSTQHIAKTLVYRIEHLHPTVAFKKNQTPKVPGKYWYCSP